MTIPPGAADRRAIRAGVAALLLLQGVPLAHNVSEIPVQISEVLDIVQYVDATPHPAAAFALGLRASRTTLRPLRQAQTKVLLDAADSLDGRYHLVFRGTHALLVMTLLALFAAAARPKTSTDAAALAVALTILIGLHTFTGMLREAYPVNHFLLVAIYGVATLAAAQSRGGWLVDAAAALFTGLALLTLESGILVAVVATAGYAAGLRGISRRGLVGIGAVVAAYMCLRLVYLDIGPPAFAERATGFGMGVLTSAEQVQRFGDRRWVLYAYTSASAVLGVLFSQPREGVWTLAKLWADDAAPPWMIIHVVSSALTTAFMLWYAVRRQSDSRRGAREPLLATAGVVILANGILSFHYAKDEIVSFAGVFYALGAYAALAGALRQAARVRLTPRCAALVAVLLGTAALWSVRVMDTHYVLRDQAFDVRNEWAYMRPTPPIHRLAIALRNEALSSRTVVPRLVHPNITRLLGDR